uniref:Uncharacterized protein n=1 Tax=Malurus cyaneus samueli TaxID=2593467 RepID=A0A8C5X7H0_9PASS
QSLLFLSLSDFEHVAVFRMLLWSVSLPIWIVGSRRGWTLIQSCSQGINGRRRHHLSPLHWQDLGDTQPSRYLAITCSLLPPPCYFLFKAHMWQQIRSGGQMFQCLKSMPSSQ